MVRINASQEAAIKNLAKQLGIKNSDWLRALIRAESNFDPLAANPRSSAKGLIQFINSTARGLGFASSQDLIDQYPDFEKQLMGPVKQYLLQYAPFPTEQSLYLSVFLPIYRHADPNTVLDERYRKVNPGIDTVGDYMYFVKNHKLPPKKKSPDLMLASLAMLGGIYFLSKRQ